MEYIFLLFGFICSIVSYSLSKAGGSTMFDNIIEIVTAIGAILAPVITIIAMGRKTNDKVDSLKNKINHFQKDIGSFPKNSLCGYLEDSQNQIRFDIGRNDNASLTKQHEFLQKLLIKEIDTAERRYNEEEKRVRDFTTEQHNMNETLESFRLFMESWKRMASDMSNMQHKINTLEIENEHLKEENRELSIKVNKNKHKDIPEL